jgi:tRNA nucleotidyltransferase (CCA-adding enzyme)
VEIYAVGGAVRDRLLGRTVSDRDWVVVGATPEALEALGYRRVGRDFPVFLHPETHEEYALARRERKTAPGYAGFSFDASATVTLAEDLGRRDLTINAMAEDATGQVIDPYGGQADLQQRVLRHVSPAFVEDPVRILRVGRFAARFDWDIAPETAALMRSMVTAGEVDALVPERIWGEWQRALTEARPVRFIQTLRDCGALERLWPEFAACFELRLPDVDQSLGERALALLEAADASAPDARARIRCASLLQVVEWMSPGSGQLGRLLERMRAPIDYRDLTRLAAVHGDTALQAPTLDAAALLALLMALDALRRPERYAEWIEVLAVRVEVERRGEAGSAAINRLRAALPAIQGVAPASLAAQGYQGPALGAALSQAREQALAALIQSG